MTRLDKQIALLHTRPILIALATTGAGAGCQSALARVPGASNTLLEGIFPYSNEAMIDLLGMLPTNFASEETAIAMARKMSKRGGDLAMRRKLNPTSVVGLGLTAVVGTNRPLRGDHRVCVATCRDEEHIQIATVRFEKKSDGFSLLSRKRECDLVDIIAINMLLLSGGIDQVPFANRGIVGGDVQPADRQYAILRPRIAVPRGRFGDSVLIAPDGKQSDITLLNPQKHILFPGSFNPFHQGHRAIANKVTQETGKKVVFMIEADHPDKGKLEPCQIDRLARQFESENLVVLTAGLRLFIDKAEAFPGFDFIVGSDTLSRLLNPKYYPFSIERMLTRFRLLKTRFLVARRDSGSGSVALAAALTHIQPECRELFSDLDIDVPFSSTAIREGVIKNNQADRGIGNDHP